MSESARLLRAAEARIPGGVNSPVRAFRGVGGDPFFVAGQAHQGGTLVVGVRVGQAPAAAPGAPGAAQ